MRELVNVLVRTMPEQPDTNVTGSVMYVVYREGHQYGVNVGLVVLDEQVTVNSRELAAVWVMANGLEVGYMEAKALFPAMAYSTFINA